MVRVVRFAPSPTGYLHLGGARTAIFNWLFARHNKGKFILRIEDTDKTRSTEESIKEIIEALKWLQIDWDEGPFRQTERREIYQREAERLLKEKKAYKCYCTPDELEKIKKEALAKGKPPKYDGRCRDLKTPPLDKPFVIRLKVNQEGETIVKDLIKGEIVFPNSQLDDFILIRSDGSPTYNFAVVVDDALMRITHVIRGDDHLNNTPKQLALYEALGYKPPKFAHVPMILGPDRTRLSKRHGATSVLAYKEEGYLPEALFNFLVRLGWSHQDQEIFTRQELISYFTLNNVGRSPAIYNPEKLKWLNSHYIKTSSNERLARDIIPFLKKQKLIENENVDRKWLEKMVATLKERSSTLKEMAQMATFYFKDPEEYDPEGAEKFLTPKVLPYLSLILKRLNELPKDEYTEEKIKQLFDGILKEEKIKLKDVAQPCRVALTGKRISPGIFEVISVLGKEKTIKRLKRAIEFIEGVSKKGG